MHQCSTGMLLCGPALVHHADKCHLLVTSVPKGLKRYSQVNGVVSVLCEKTDGATCELTLCIYIYGHLHPLLYNVHLLMRLVLSLD